MAENGSNRKVANSLVALSSAAILAVYGAGYARTRAAADRFAQQAAERRPHIPTPRDDDTPAPRRQAITATTPRSAEDAATTPASADTRSAPLVAKATAEATPAAPATAPATPRVDAAPKVTFADAPPVETATAAPVTATPAAAPTQDEAAPVAPPAASASAEKSAAYRDGTYFGWGTSRHGDIQAAVVIEGGRITTARVAQCLTRYSCSWITPIPPRILSRQGVTYDYVSGATESSDAFQDAIAEALSQAQ